MHRPRPSARTAAVLAVAGLLLTGCGSDDETEPVAAAQEATPSATMGEKHSHTHEGVEWPTDLPRPTVDLAVTPDAKSGWNVQIKTTDFRWAPEHASDERVPGEGHAHLYVDGEKLTRVYGEWLYIGELEPGDHQIRVDLNANDHSPWLVDGEPLDAVEFVEVPEK